MENLTDPQDPKRIVAEGYDRAAQAYSRLDETGEWPRLRWLRKVLEQLPPGAPVLDLGCGSGDPADIEIAKQHQVTGVDISAAQIELARKRVPEGTFIHGDAASLAIPAGSFAAVVSFYTLEHIPRWQHAALLARLCEWLQPGGLLLVSMEAGEVEGIVSEWLEVPMYFSCYDPETTRELIRAAGFEIVEYAVETQLEGETEIPYHWVLARKA